MLFHRFKGWNLAYSLYDDAKLNAIGKEGFVGMRFEEGFRQGWIRPNFVREALEMFVLDEDPLLPPDLDIDIRPCEDHLRWWGSAFPDLASQAEGRYQTSAIRALKPQIMSSLHQRQISISDQEFEQILHRVEHTSETSRWGISGKLLSEIEFEFRSANLSLKLAACGVPTYGADYLTAQKPLDTTKTISETDDLTVARFYFKNQILVPSPEKFSEALDLRNNERIAAWRAQIKLWSSMLKDGSTDWKGIDAAIKDANGYIEGASFPSRLLPHWVSLITLPAAYVHTFHGHGDAAHMIGLGLFAYEVLHMYGWLTENSVNGRNPLEYQWLLTSTHGK